MERLLRWAMHDMLINSGLRCVFLMYHLPQAQVVSSLIADGRDPTPYRAPLMHRLSISVAAGARCSAVRGARARAVERCMRPGTPACIQAAVATPAAAAAPAAASSLTHSSMAMAATGCGRALHSSAVHHARPVSPWLQFLTDHATRSSLVHKLADALRMIRDSADPLSERDILVALRKAMDAAAYVLKKVERDTGRWRARKGMDLKLQQSLRVLYTGCVQLMSLAPLNHLPLERWRLDRGTLRAFLIVAVRCGAYESACNLIAHCESQHPINLWKMESGDIYSASRHDQPVTSQVLDSDMVSAMLTALSRSRPKPGAVEKVEDMEGNTSLFQRVLDAAPATFTAERSAAMCEAILQRIVSLPGAHVSQIPLSSSMLESLSVLFTAHPDPQLRALVFAKDQRAQTITVPLPSSSGKTRYTRLGWNPDAEDHDSYRAQGRSIVRAWETYLLSRAAAADFKWPSGATSLTDLFLHPLARLAESATLPLMRSDLLAGVLYASSVRNLDRFPLVFERMRICFPGPAVSVGEFSYGMDAGVWTVALHVMLSHALQPAEAASLFAEACRVVPRRLHLPLINAYLGYLCEASAETLPERWTRMQQVLANALRTDAVPSTAPVALPQTLAETAHAAAADADELAAQDSFAVTQPDLVLYSHVIRMLDRLHEQHIPFALLGQSTVASPAPLPPSSAMGAFLTIFDAPDPNAEIDPTASGWQLIADELHHRAQEEREREDVPQTRAPQRALARRGGAMPEAVPAAGPGFFRFNPLTHNLFVPTSGMHAADDQWIFAMCRLACRALQRAGQMKSVFEAQGGGGQPLTLVVETEADTRKHGLATEDGRPASKHSSTVTAVDPSAAAYWRSLSHTPVVIAPVSLPSDWLYEFQSSLAARLRGDRPTPMPAEWLRPAVRPSERVLRAINRVFEEMEWKQHEPATVERHMRANTATTVPNAHSKPALAREFVFTFDATAPR